MKRVNGYFILILAFFQIQDLISSDIRINEAVSTNANNLYDDSHDTPDWIELYNTSDDTINVKGYRIYDKDNMEKAWKLPDTLIHPKSYLVIYASGEDTLTTGKFAIESSGWGLFHHARWDGFRFDYVHVNGDFEISVDVNNIPSYSPYSPHGGLVVKEELDEKSLFVALHYINMQNKNWYWWTSRKMMDHYPEYKFPNFTNQNKTGWLRMKRVGDTVYTYCQDGEGYSIESHADYFPKPDVYIGLGTASNNDTILLKFTFSNLRINGQPFDYRNLKEYEINARIPGRKYESREMHTNFKLDKDGETIYLWDSNGVLIDNVTCGYLQPDISYGRVPDGAETFKCLKNGTPGKSNASVTGFTGILKQPAYSINGGWFDHPLVVRIISNQADSVYYTIDGSEPDDRSHLYKGEAIKIDSNTVIRARAYKTAYLPSDIFTRTFFIKDSSLLPVIALSTNEELIHNDDSTGMFDKIFSYITCTVNYEIFSTDKRLSYENLSEMRIIGHGPARANGQPSLRMDARKNLGDNEYKYPFFANNSLDDYETFVLSNSSNDWPLSFMRDIFVSNIARRLPSQIAPASQPVISFINGKLWGLYNLREHINESYLSSRYHIPEDSVCVYRNFSEITAGSINSFHIFTDSLDKLNINSEYAYDYINKNIDVDNIIDYTILSLYTSNYDWPGWNIKQWKSNAYDGKWRYICNDFDWTFGADSYVTHPENDCILRFFRLRADTTIKFVKLFTWILDNEKLRFKFINRTADLLNSEFLPGTIISLIDSMHNNIKAEVPRQKALRPGCLYYFNESHQSMINFANKRPEFVRRDMVEQFKLSGIARLRIKTNTSDKIKIRVNSIAVNSNRFDGIYFKDVPIEIEITGRDFSDFVGWSDPKLPKKTKITVVLIDSLDLEAIFANIPDAKELVVNEIMYKPEDLKDCKDWFELYNPNDFSIALASFSFRDDNDSHQYVFPETLTIKPHDYLVVAEDIDAFRGVYPEVANVTGTFSFGIGLNDIIRIYNKYGLVEDSVCYLDADPWPNTASGTGFSIELKDPSLDNNRGENWHTSGDKYGTPGVENSIRTNSKDKYTSIIDDILLSPNPVENILEVQFYIESPADVRITITSYTGNLLLAIEKSFEAGRNSERIDVNNLPVGIYFMSMEVFTEKGSEIRNVKFIKI